MKTWYKITVLGIFVLALACTGGKKKTNTSATKVTGLKWSKERAWEWYNALPWLVGTNFNPSSSINQLEFWQADTFDPETIDRELKWSADLGMNLHRVYLHNLLWEQDSLGFLKRLDNYLRIADSHGIQTMFVLLDDVWHPIPKLGKQPEPIPHVHNSGWVQAPGATILGDTLRHNGLEGYIKGVVRAFAKDHRVLVWDVYNEPDNVAMQPGRAAMEVRNKHDFSLALLRKVMRWCREVDPDQPLTSGIWRGNLRNWGKLDSLPDVDRYMLENSDIISFHAYDGSMEDIRQKITELQTYGRPLLCTEYLARGTGNTFEQVMPIFKKDKVAAINWGLVSGKSNTIYPWISWDSTFTGEPHVWHHDVLRPDGTPFSPEEVAFIKEMTRNP
ncbi:MAG: 1,4-beta-xylanase [Bacteroidota bacterium]